MIKCIFLNFSNPNPIISEQNVLFNMAFLAKTKLNLFDVVKYYDR